MKKFNLTIPEPCHQNWDEMSKAEKGRFCSSCQKTVVDFTGMNDRQLAAFFKKPTTGSVCGRFMQDQLHRNIAPPKKRLPWIKYFFQISLPALLFSAKAVAQGKVVAKPDTTAAPSKQKPAGLKKTDCTLPAITLGAPVFDPNDTAFQREQLQPQKRMVSGKVMDGSGKPVEGATVTLKQGRFQSAVATTDSSGDFMVWFEIRKDLILMVKHPEYQTDIMRIDDEVTEKYVWLQKGSDKDRTPLGMFAIEWEETKPIPLIARLIDTATSKFSVFPNPVRQNTSLGISTKSLEKGEYFFSLINTAGEPVQAVMINIEKKGQTAEIVLEHFAAGNYFVRLTNRKTGKSYTQKIVVQ